MPLKNLQLVMSNSRVKVRISEVPSTSWQGTRFGEEAGRSSSRKALVGWLRFHRRPGKRLILKRVKYSSNDAQSICRQHWNRHLPSEWKERLAREQKGEFPQVQEHVKRTPVQRMQQQSKATYCKQQQECRFPTE